MHQQMVPKAAEQLAEKGGIRWYTQRNDGDGLKK
jgi:hypothetical protein